MIGADRRTGGLGCRGAVVAALICLGLGRGLAGDFNFQVRPLLSDRCYACHGPDENARKAKLRLDTREGLYREAGKGRSIVKPGDLAGSELYRRLTSKDPEERMPPLDSGLSISAAELERVRTWIESGAEWESHWAWEPVKEVAMPVVKQPDWARNEVDLFILARLEAQGLAPAGEASREELLRRVTFDLSGLPPTLEEMEMFLGDTEPGAYERVVERLLASASYGERMAVDWLDVARYADTYGYQADRFNHLWPWRDWVIEAFNSNVAYDDFIVWQIAGDLLPGATREQYLATAFNRNHRQTNEGGSVNEEFRVEYNADRLHTTGTAFLGLTLECARCHDHKYDPITQREYYRLFAFFNGTDESGLYSHFTDAIPNPTLLLYGPGQEQEEQRLQSAIREAERQWRARAGEVDEAFERWIAADPTIPPARGLAADYSFDRIDAGTVTNGVAGPAGKLVDAPIQVPGQEGGALQFSGENSVVFEGIGEFRRTDPFSLSLRVWIAEEKDEIILAHRSKAGSDAGSKGYQLQLEQGRATFALIHFWPGNAIKVRTRDKLPLNRWLNLGVSYDGSSRAAGMRIYVEGKPVALEIERDHLFKDIVYADKTPLTLAARFRCRGFKDGKVDAFRVYDRELTALEMARQCGPLVGDRAAIEVDADLCAGSVPRASLLEYYLACVDEEAGRRLAELHRLRQQESKLIESVPEIMVMGDLPGGRPTHILRRGAYDAPGEEVTPGLPAALAEWNPAWPSNRLGLARWLVDRGNPLTARVAVNRYWQIFFGRGLVSTPENFGVQGELPSHPELLDWLAGWFMDHDWDLKGLCRLLTGSATYRQSAVVSDQARLRDPENRLWGRATRRRLSAEMLRDQALSASGLLVRRLGGPSVKPYQPEGLWEEKSGTPYQQDKGQGLYRRSLYTFWKRTSPHPAMTTFDATSRETCIARRQVTSTPLQALVLLNDPQFVEASRLLGERMLREGGGTVDGRLRLAFRVLIGRHPTAAEVGVLASLYEGQRAIFAGDPSLAAVLSKAGEAPAAAWADPVELAACTAVASALMNFDAAVKR